MLFLLPVFLPTLDLRRTSDKIAQSVRVDQQLVRNLQWINVNHETTTFFNSSFSTPVRSVGLKINIKGNISNTRTFAFIDGLSDKVNRWNSRLDLNLENRKKEYLDFLLGVRFNNNSSSYANNKPLDYNFLRQTYYANMSIYFFDSWEIYSSMNFMMFPKRGELVQEQIPLWTASVSKSFLKNDQGQLSLAVFDIFAVKQKLQPGKSV